MPIHFTEDPDFDRLVNSDPLALLIAMLLDQQVPLIWAFNGPNRLAERLGRARGDQALDKRGLDAHEIAAFDPDAFAALAGQKPAIHRYHRSMAARIQALCGHVIEYHEGTASSIWTAATDASTVLERLKALPGFGDEKAKITLAVLVKRFDRRFDDWEVVAAPFSDDQPRSVADVGSPAAFERVKAWKKAQKAAGRDKQD